MEDIEKLEKQIKNIDTEIKNIKNNIDKRNKRIESQEEFKKRLQEKIEEIKKSKQKRYRAVKYDEYYCAGRSGEVEKQVEFNDGVDGFSFFTHNYFKTKEEAQRHLDNIKTYYELKDLADELNAGEKIDWNEDQVKYFIYFDYEDKKLEKNWNCEVKDLGQVYCLDENFLDKAIERIGEEKIISLFEEE